MQLLQQQLGAQIGVQRRGIALRTRVSGVQRKERASGLRCRAALSAPLEAVVTAAETVEKVLPKVEKVVGATTADVLSATAGTREEAVRSFKPIVDAFVKFAARQASDPSLKKAVASLGGSVADSLKDASAALKPAAAVLTPDTAAAAAVAVGAVALGVLLLSLGNGRQYKADLRAPEALDAVLLRGATIVDIRSAQDVTSKGNPTLSGSAARLLKRVPLGDGLGSGRGKVRDAGAVERARLALKIKNLQGLSRGAEIVILDASGRDAPGVANELAAAGFSNVSVVSGGFQAWLNCKLPSKAAFQAFGADAGFFPAMPAKRAAARPVTVEVVASAPAPRALPPPKVAALPAPKPKPAPAAPVKKTGSTVTVTAKAVAAKPAAALLPAKKAGSSTTVVAKVKALPPPAVKSKPAGAGSKVVAKKKPGTAVAAAGTKKK